MHLTRLILVRGSLLVHRVDVFHYTAVEALVEQPSSEYFTNCPSEQRPDDCGRLSCAQSPAQNTYRQRINHYATLS